MKRTIQFDRRSFSELNADLRKIIDEKTDGIVRKDGAVYFRIGSAVYSCPEDSEASSMLEWLIQKEDIASEPMEKDRIWMSVLKGTADQTVCNRYGILDKMIRCVILFRTVPRTENHLLRASIPLKDTDRTVMTDEGDIAVILNMVGVTEEDAEEYAAAVTETMESEAGIVCCAGIGRPVSTADTLPDSYQEARGALETGLRYRLTGRVYSYSRQALERLADLVPESSVNLIRRQILHPDAEKILTNEMMETARAFFQNDLNLSTTARKLFIHRNTLLYRMDKIRKATGLDLRKFEDAVVFRFLMSFSDRQENQDQ